MPAWSGLQKVTSRQHRAGFSPAIFSPRSRRGRSAERRRDHARAEEVAAAFKAACLDELDAPKPGNVHVFASGHRMTAVGVRP